MVLSKCPRLCLVALCEAEEAPPARSKPCVVESRFNWKLFWQFLRPHLLVLGAAVVVRSSPAPPKPKTRKDLARGLQKPEPELCRGSLTALSSLRRDLRKRQGLAWGLGAKSYQENLHRAAGCAGFRGPQGLAAWALSRSS